MQRSQQKIAKLRRKQLDETYADIVPFLARMPRGGWIKDVRSALGMSAAQMARLLDISKPTLARLEKNEASSAITLKSLERIAAIMKCRFVYALVPDEGYESLDAILKERAHQVATNIINAAAQTMALESQSISAARRTSMIEELAAELAQNLDKRLWERK